MSFFERDDSTGRDPIPFDGSGPGLEISSARPNPVGDVVRPVTTP